MPYYVTNIAKFAARHFLFCTAVFAESKKVRRGRVFYLGGFL